MHKVTVYALTYKRNGRSTQLDFSFETSSENYYGEVLARMMSKRNFHEFIGCGVQINNEAVILEVNFGTYMLQEEGTDKVLTSQKEC